MEIQYFLKERSFLLKVCIISVFVSVTTLLVFFVFHITKITEQFYLIRTSQAKIAEFSQENRDLKTNLLSSNFLKNSEILAEENYEEVGRVHYVSILSDTSIAKKTQP